MHASFWSRAARYNRYVEMMIELGRIAGRDCTLVGPVPCGRGGCDNKVSAIPRWATGTTFVLCSMHVEAVDADRRMRRMLDSKVDAPPPRMAWEHVHDAAAQAVAKIRKRSLTLTRRKT